MDVKNIKEGPQDNNQWNKEEDACGSDEGEIRRHMQFKERFTYFENLASNCDRSNNFEEKRRERTVPKQVTENYGDERASSACETERAEKETETVQPHNFEAVEQPNMASETDRAKDKVLEADVRQLEISDDVEQSDMAHEVDEANAGAIAAVRQDENNGQPNMVHGVAETGHGAPAPVIELPQNVEDNGRPDRAQEADMSGDRIPEAGLEQGVEGNGPMDGAHEADPPYAGEIETGIQPLQNVNDNEDGNRIHEVHRADHGAIAAAVEANEQPNRQVEVNEIGAIGAELQQDNNAAREQPIHARPEQVDTHDLNFKILKRFSSLTEFEKFSRSYRGLKLPESILSNLTEPTPEEKMRHLLLEWSDTYDVKPHEYCARLEKVVNGYFKSRNHYDEEQILQRYEDTFQYIIIPRFSRVSHFNEFARSSSGLAISDTIISELERNYPKDVFRYKMEVLKYWRMYNDGVPTHKIVELKTYFLAKYRG